MNAPKANEETLFEALSQLAIDQRAAYLEQACGQDLALRGRLEILLRAHERGGAFMAEPVAPVIPRNAGLPIPLTERLGDSIDHYKLLQQIGEGGCGVVYMAQQEEPVRRLVALKVIKLGMDTKQVVGRFEAERQALALMDHPNIAKVLDAGATETGRPYFVMELVRGVKITDYCNENSLSTRERLELFVEVCQAIQHAHQKGIIHRDIKPSNVLVTVNDGAAMPKVIDFGIAKATQGRLTDQTVVTRFEQFLGTPAYMSPEQALPTSVDIDTRSDIYSLGVLLYEMLTGKTPFDTEKLEASGLEEMLRTIREIEPVRPSTRVSAMPVEEQTTTAGRRRTEAPKLISLLRGDLDWIVMKCLEKDRARRYQTANGLAKDIQRHLSNEPVLARPPSRIYEFQKTVRRHRVGFAASAAVIATLAGGVLVSTWQAVRAHREREHALQNVVHQYVANGTRLMNEGDLFGSLLWYAEALRMDAGDHRREEAHRIRIASVLEQCPKLLNIFSHGTMLYRAEFSPDGSKVVTASDDRTARIWDTTTGRLLQVLHHGGEVYDAVFSSDGLRIVTSSLDKTARVWDGRTGALLQTLAHKSAVGRSCFSSKGLIATACQDNAAQLWNSETGELVGKPLLHDAIVRRVTFSPDGELLATITEHDAAYLWEVATGHLLRKFPHNGSFAADVGFSADSQRFLTCDAASLHVWDAHTLKEDVFSPLALGGIINSGSFSPDGGMIAAASDNSTARVYDGTSGKALFSQAIRQSGPIASASFSADGRRLVTAGVDTVAQFWSPRTGQPAGPPLKHILSSRKVTFSPDGRCLLSDSSDQAARVWDMAAMGTAAVARPAITNEHRITSPSGGNILLQGQSNIVWIADTKSGKKLGLPHANWVVYASFSGDGRTVITACKSGSEESGLSHEIHLFLWDASSGAPVSQVKTEHGAKLAYVAFSPDGNRFLTCCFDFSARVWDIRTGQPLSPLLWHRQPVSWGVFGPDGRSVVTASWDKTVRIWDTATWHPIILQHQAAVVGATWSTDRRRFTTLTEDDHLQVWDLASAEPLTPPRKINAIQDSPTVPDTPAGAQPSEKTPHDDRQISDIVSLAQLLAAGRINDNGSIVPLQIQELRTAWQGLHEKLTNQFTVTPAEAVAWHRREAEDSQKEGNWAAALFHFDRVLGKQPDNTVVAQRRVELAANLRTGSGGLVNPSNRYWPIPPRNSNATADQIDLAKHYNLRLQDSLNQTPDGDDFSDLAAGVHTMGGVRFDVRGLVHLNGQHMKEVAHPYPVQVSDIRVARKCRRLHFLQATHWESEDGTKVGAYVLHYKDGRQHELPIVFGRDLHDKWFSSAPPESEQPGDAFPVWTGGNRLASANGSWICLYKSTHENPWPEVELVSIDFVSTMSFSAPFLVALTVQ